MSIQHNRCNKLAMSIQSSSGFDLPVAEQEYLDRLDRVYRTRPEQMVNTANEQDFNAELAELRANLREMRLVLAEIGRAMGPWDWDRSC